MQCKIFYSWQSDLPNATNRGFIEKALENATKSLRDNESIKVSCCVSKLYILGREERGGRREAEKV